MANRFCYGVYSRSHSFGYLVLLNLTLLVLPTFGSAAVSVLDLSGTVSILNLMLMALPLIWFCNSVYIDVTLLATWFLLRLQCLFSISRLGFTIKLVLPRYIF